MDKKSKAHYKKLLMEKRAQMEQAYRDKLTRTGDESADGALDPADKAYVNYNKEFWFSMSDTDRHIIRMIDDALNQTDKENFGLCVNCTKPIQKKRMEAVPWARHCIACQDLQDRGLL